MNAEATRTTTPAGGRRILWINVMTVVSAAILIGAEVFGAAFAGNWAIAKLFGLGDTIGRVSRRHLPRARRLHHVQVRALRAEGRAVQTLRQRLAPMPGRGSTSRQKNSPRARFSAALLKSEKPLVLLGAYDALGARLIAQAGGKSLFIGGFSVVGARYGVPDVGLRAYADIAAAVRDIVNACDLPAFVDIDDGYGDVKNVIQTVQGYERHGRRRHDAGGPDLAEALRPPRRQDRGAGRGDGGEGPRRRRRAARSHRPSSSRAPMREPCTGSTMRMRRAERYLRAGADGLFIEAPESVEELDRIGRAFDVPLVANPLEGGKTPLLSPAEFAELGFHRHSLRHHAHSPRRQGDAGGDRRRDVRRLRAARRGDELPRLSRRGRRARLGRIAGQIRRRVTPSPKAHHAFSAAADPVSAQHQFQPRPQMDDAHQDVHRNHAGERKSRLAWNTRRPKPRHQMRRSAAP